MKMSDADGNGVLLIDWWRLMKLRLYHLNENES